MLRSLPVPRLGPLSLRVEVVHLVCLLGSAARLSRALEALPLIRAVHRIWVCLAQKMKAKHLLELLSPPAVPAPVYLAGPVKPALPVALQPLVDCQLVVRPRELAAGCSWDFQF